MSAMACGCDPDIPYRSTECPARHAIVFDAVRCRDVLFDADGKRVTSEAPSRCEDLTLPVRFAGWEPCSESEIYPLWAVGALGRVERSALSRNAAHTGMVEVVAYARDGVTVFVVDPRTRQVWRATYQIAALNRDT